MRPIGPRCAYREAVPMAANGETFENMSFDPKPPVR
jgi:hypothetical protein